jgi:hypothetical protein
MTDALRRRALVFGVSGALLTIGPAVWVLDDVLRSGPPPSVGVDVRGKWCNEDASVMLEFNRWHVCSPSTHPHTHARTPCGSAFVKSAWMHALCSLHQGRVGVAYSA